jgi:uncharacterized protein
MSGLIDTNILLYAANSDSDEHQNAYQFLAHAAITADPWYLTEGIIYEFLRVSTHARVFPHPLTWKKALEFVNPLLTNDNFMLLVCADDHWNELEKTLETLSYPSGNLFFDIRTVILMKEHGIRRIYTTDTDFLQFTGIEVVNPLHKPSAQK